MKIVAPAGNMERFYSAVNAGADEIYMGLKGFGARRNAQNFTLDEFKEALVYAHERGSRIFLTLNTMMQNVEIEFLRENFKVLYEAGLDAVIIQDLGYFRFLKENFPNIDYHGSTQMTVANHVEANYLKSIGFKRVVLSRELSFEEIKKIRENTDIEIEVFVSGALCISYSGNCYMSSFIGGRSGNRGMCAQPCRKFYTSDSKDKGYLLSPKDQLMSFEEIKKLNEIGIDSIKIEGRMKEKNYVFEAVTYFKNLINGSNREENISTIFNRGYSKGYFYHNNENKNKVKEEVMNKNYSYNMGKLLGKISGKEISLNENIVLGDGIIYLTENYEKIGGEYINKIIKKNKKEKFKFANAGDRIVLLNAPHGAKYVYKNYDKNTNDTIDTEFKNADKKKIITLEFTGKENELPKLKAKTINSLGKEILVTLEGENLIEKANKRGADVGNVREKLSETGETTFEIGKCDVYIDNNIFLPLSVLKQLRRDALELLREKLVKSYERKADNKNIFRIEILEDKPKHAEISVVVTTKEQEEIVKSLGIKKIYKRQIDVAREGNLEKIDLNSHLATNLYQVLKNKTDDITVGWNLNIANIYTINEYAKIKNVNTVILSPEISFEKISSIGKVPVRKALLGYSKLKGMYTELPIFKDGEIFKNENNDKFITRINGLGNTEIYFEKPLNILSQVRRLSKIGIDEVVIELLDETKDEIIGLIENIDKKENSYSPYNYERGVF